MVDNWGLHLFPLFVVGGEGLVGGGGRNLVQGSKFKIMFSNCLKNKKDKGTFFLFFYILKDRNSLQNCSKNIFILYLCFCLFIQTRVCYFYIYLFFNLEILTNHILKQFLFNLNMHSLFRGDIIHWIWNMVKKFWLWGFLLQEKNK